MMTFRRTVVVLTAIAALTLTGCATQSTGDKGGESEYPNQSIRLLIPYGAGGGTDLSARLMVSGLEEDLGARVVVVNDPSSSGQNALQAVATADPDGYTLGFVALPATNMMYLDKSRGATFTGESFTAIANHDTDAVAVAVSASSPYKTLDDLLEAAEKSPGSVTAGSSGVLATGHLGILALQEAAGVKIVWTTFEDSGQLRTSVLGESVTIEVGPVSELASAHKAGDLRILALLSSEKQPGLEDVPTIVELGYEDAIVATNRALIGPAGLPADIVEKLSASVKKSMESEAYKTQAASRSLTLNYLNTDDVTAMWKRFDSSFGPIAEAFRAGE